MKKILTIIAVMFYINSNAQFYVGFNGGTYKNKPQAGFVVGLQDNNVRLQVTQIVPITTNNTYPVFHDFTASFGNKISIYAGGTLGLNGSNANTFWKPSAGLSYYKNTWFVSAGLINNQFKISFACIKLF